MQTCLSRPRVAPVSRSLRSSTRVCSTADGAAVTAPKIPGSPEEQVSAGGILRQSPFDPPLSHIVVISLPIPPTSQVRQAVQAIKSARAAGIKCQIITLLIPLLYATDLDDRPGGIREEFKAGLPLVESILKAIKQEEGLQGPLTPSFLDEADAVSMWKGENLTAVMFPTAETIKQVMEAEKSSGKGLFLMINPQWSNKGQLIPDFGAFYSPLLHPDTRVATARVTDTLPKHSHARTRMHRSLWSQGEGGLFEEIHRKLSLPAAQVRGNERQGSTCAPHRMASF